MAKKVKKTKTKTRAKARTTKNSDSFKLSKQNKIILGSLLMLFGVALFFSFISFYFTWQEDQSSLSEFSIRNEAAENLLNKFGAAVSHFFIYKGFGLAALIIPGLLFFSGLKYFLSMSTKGLIKKYIWGLLFMIWISIALGFFAVTKPLLGGLIGYEMNDFLQDYTGKIGVFLMLLFGLVFILVRFFKFTPDGMFNFFQEKKDSLASSLKQEKSMTEAGSTIEMALENEEQELPLKTLRWKWNIL